MKIRKVTPQMLVDDIHLFVLVVCLKSKHSIRIHQIETGKTKYYSIDKKMELFDINVTFLPGGEYE
jgi:hypothetical protein